jgi:intein/homing endonuclease/phage terminase large subunit-like protein
MRVMMADGTWKALRKISVGDSVIGKSGRSCKVLKVHKQGNLDCVQINTFGGRKIITAKDHPILTADGWQEAGAIQPETMLALMHHPKIQATTEKKDDEFTLAGYFIGDGSVSSNNCSVVNQTPEYIEDFIKCADRLGFDHSIRRQKNNVTTISLKERKVPGGNRGRYKGKGRGYRETRGPRLWLKQVGIAGKDSYTKRVPDFVWKGTNEQVAKFLAAYFHCDGCISYRGGKKRAMAVFFSTVSKNLAKGIQRLLLRLGISMRIRRREAKPSMKCHGDVMKGTKNKKYNPGAKGYVSYSIETTDQDAASRFVEIIPVRGYKLERLKAFHPNRKTFDQQWWPDRVESTEEIGELPCRCLTVEGDASFVVDGVVVHNSTIASILFQPWVWTNMPRARFMGGTYTENLGMDLAGKALAVIDSEKYKLLFPHVKLVSRTASHFSNTDGGERRLCTVGGKSPLGFHAHFLCLPHEVRIKTDKGWLPIGDVVEQRLQVKVQGFDHATNQAVWEDITAWQSTPIRPVSRVWFSDGSSLEATDNHPFFVIGKGYVRVDQLVSGDEVIHDASVPCLQEDVLSKPETSSENEIGMGVLRTPASGGVHERNEPSSIQQHREQVRKVWEGDTRGEGADRDEPILQLQMSWGSSEGGIASQVGGTDDGPMCLLHEGNRSPFRGCKEQRTLLFPDVRGRFAFDKDEREGQFQLAARKGEQQVSESSDEDAAKDPQAGQVQVSALRHVSESALEISGGEIECTPHRLRPDQQQGRQPDHALQEMPREATWQDSLPTSLGTKTVVAVNRAVRIPGALYNLEVSRTHNFFAEGILVHNSLDDPIDPKGALSQAELDNAAHFCETVLPSRKVNREVTFTYVIMQRLGRGDPSEVMMEIGRRPGSIPVRHVCLPGELSDDVNPPEYRSIYVNGLLDPLRFPKKVLDNYRARGAMFYCTPGFTPILMSDWTEKKIEDVQVGDEVVGYIPSVHKGTGKRGRPTKIRSTVNKSIVLAKTKFHREVVKVTLQSGKEIYCTPDHCWWTRRTDEGSGRKPYLPARVGSRLFPVYDFLQEETPEQQRWLDWLGGILDGEGSCSGSQIAITQSHVKNPAVCKRIKKVLRLLGIPWTEQKWGPHSPGDLSPRGNVYKDNSSGGMMFYLQSTRSIKVRLLSHAKIVKRRRIINSIWRRYQFVAQGRGDKVVKIESAGKMDVYGLTTTTGNYVAWGFASQNSSQVQQNPLVLGGGMFEQQWFSQRVKAAPHHARRVRHWDRASSEGSGCNTAGVLMSFDGVNYFVEDCKKGQWEPVKRNAMIKASAIEDRSRYGPDYEPVIEIEEEGGSTAADARKMLAAELAGFKFRFVHPTGSKDLRAEPWSCQLAAGNVFFVDNGESQGTGKATWDIQGFVEEHVLFRPESGKRLGKWKDQVDAASGCFNHLFQRAGGRDSMRIISIGAKKGLVRIVVCARDNLDSAVVVEPSLLISCEDPFFKDGALQPPSDDPPHHALENLIGHCKLTFADIDPAEKQESWDQPVEPWGVPASQLVIMLQEAKKASALVLKKRDTAAQVIVVCDNGGEDRRGLSVAMALCDLLMIPRENGIWWLENPTWKCVKDMKAPNEHAWLMVKRSRGLVVS